MFTDNGGAVKARKIVTVLVVRAENGEMESVYVYPLIKTIRVFVASWWLEKVTSIMFPRRQNGRLNGRSAN